MRNLQATRSFNWFNEVWNKNQRSAIDLFATEGVIAHNLSSDGPMIGRDSFKKFFDDFTGNFRNIQVDIAEVVSENDLESCVCTVSAVHRESGKPVSFSGQCTSRFEGNQIAEAWNNFDFLSLNQQLSNPN